MYIVLGLWEQHVEPYRHDNARLSQENLDLHQKLMKLKETSESRNKELKTLLRRLEHESNDLKFLNTQYMQRLLSQEKESQQKSEKILELQEKNLQAVIHTPGGRKKSIPFRRQRMEIDSTLPENPIGRSKKIAPVSTPDPYIADLLKMADVRVDQLQKQIVDGEKIRKQLSESIQDLNKQVDINQADLSISIYLLILTRVQFVYLSFIHQSIH